MVARTAHRTGRISSDTVRRLPALAIAALLFSAGCGDNPGSPVATTTGALSAGNPVTCVTIQRGSFGAVADATIKSNALGKNFGSLPVLRVSAKDESLIKFELGSIPSTAALRSATLKLYVNGDAGDGTIQVHSVLVPWLESSVTSANFKHGFADKWAGAFRVQSRNSLKSVDIKALVSSWISGVQPNFGLVLLAGSDHHADCDRDEDEDRAPTIFVSSDASNLSKRPALEVCYSLPSNGCAATPCLNGGSCTNTETGYSCACAPGFTGQDCASNIDDCAANPCQNGGRCSDGVGGYSCACAAGFSGPSCELNVDDCSPNPCQNGGICSDRVAGYSCECAPGYDGGDCGHWIDSCAGSPCHNGGVCSSGVNSYACACALGYSGTNCDINVDDCSGNPCANGGTCVDGIDRYTCSCAPDWGGSRCEVNLNTCAQQPCLNGATCTSGAGSYICNCAAGYTGTNCEIDIDDCAQGPCQNGGICVDGVNGYTCSCPAGFQGATCGEPSSCGGISNLPCATGMACIDDNADNCDPANGGGDCPGICVKANECRVVGCAAGQFCGYCWGSFACLPNGAVC